MAKSGGKKDLDGRTKAAILLVTLGPDISSGIYKHLEESIIELLTLEIANLRKIDSETKAAVLKEAQEILMAKEFLTQGGGGLCPDPSGECSRSRTSPGDSAAYHRKPPGAPLRFHAAYRCLPAFEFYSGRASPDHCPDSLLPLPGAGGGHYGGAWGECAVGSGAAYRHHGPGDPGGLAGGGTSA